MSAIRRRLLAAVSSAKSDPLAGANIGDPALGGYYAGIIDTTKGNIIATDDSQSGKRYALIVAPKSLETTARLIEGGAADPDGTQTRWDGLAATAAMAASANTYPAADYCAALAYPSDGASGWYLPAMDELELIFRGFKPTTESNYAPTRDSFGFPGASGDVGSNPSSDPTGGAYTSAAPTQTTVAAFREGGAQSMGTTGSVVRYWSSTEGASTVTWAQNFSGGGAGAGYQYRYTKTNAIQVRPVRRLLL